MRPLTYDFCAASLLGATAFALIMRPHEPYVWVLGTLSVLVAFGCLRMAYLGRRRSR